MFLMSVQLSFGLVYKGYLMPNERVYALIFASVYPHYVKKAETKGQTRGVLDEVIVRNGHVNGTGSVSADGLFGAAVL